MQEEQNFNNIQLFLNSSALLTLGKLSSQTRELYFLFVTLVMKNNDQDNVNLNYDKAKILAKKYDITLTKFNYEKALQK